MSSCITTIKEYIKHNNHDFGCDHLNSLLEQLWFIYTSCNPIDSDRLQVKLTALEPMINQFSQKRRRRLLHLIQELQVEHEREAFCEGIRVEAQLIFELMDDAPH